jgi:predicted SprT family Zn-dependent metalloprotease
MTLKIKIGNPKYFEDIVTHEILHIFQYNKNQKKYENDSLYKILNKIRKNIENYNDTDILFAQALYISYDFEQDAMVHGLFKELEQYDNYIIQFKLRETDEYMFLVDLRHAIKNIDQFDESLFENKLSKSAFLNRLQKAEQRYSTKINHIVQHIFDIRENFDGLVPHYPYISPKRIRAIFEKYEMHDNSENHLNSVKEILKID